MIWALSIHQYLALTWRENYWILEWEVGLQLGVELLLALIAARWLFLPLDKIRLRSAPLPKWLRHFMRFSVRKWVPSRSREKLKIKLIETGKLLLLLLGKQKVSQTWFAERFCGDLSLLCLKGWDSVDTVDVVNGLEVSDTKLHSPHAFCVSQSLSSSLR